MHPDEIKEKAFLTRKFIIDLDHQMKGSVSFTLKGSLNPYHEFSREINLLQWVSSNMLQKKQRKRALKFF
jgi:hypothetical protein